LQLGSSSTGRRVRTQDFRTILFIAISSIVDALLYTMDSSGVRQSVLGSRDSKTKHLDTSRPDQKGKSDEKDHGVLAKFKGEYIGMIAEVRKQQVHVVILHKATT